jgi:3-oxoacyl-[acyl-carrier protein] reductase
VALVTGSSRGIGRAIAERLAADGAAVAVHYEIRQQAGQTVAEKLRATGANAESFRADVCREQEVCRLFDQVEATLGGVDILINNAGIHRAARIHRLALTDWEAVLRVNLYGTFHCMRRAIPGMLDRHWGRIVNISSPLALRGCPGEGAYTAAKAAQLGLTRCAGAELAATGVTVNAVLPGLVPTEMTENLAPASRQHLEGSIPARRNARPEEVAAAVAYLVSPEAAYVIGTALAVDGGAVL